MSDTPPRAAQAVGSAWFSYDPAGGFDLHVTADAARSRAQACFDDYQDEAPDGWAEEVTGVVWGMVCGGVEEKERRPVDRDQDMVTDAVDEIVVYELEEYPWSPALAAAAPGAGGGPR